MRILHTSDWHLGRTLEGRPRDDEHRAVLREIAALLERERVDLLLVAGDVFDSGNPSGSAEQLFFDAMEEMSAGGRRGIVVLAGNHDSPERLVAPSPLASRLGISILGLPSDQLPIPESRAQGLAHRVASAPAFVELSLPGVAFPVCVAALPYPSEARLAQVLPEEPPEPGERAAQRAYSTRLGGLMTELAARFRPDAVNLLASHLFVDGGIESDSERPIQLGGACAVAPGSFPEAAQYVALGHLHRPQAVVGSPVPARYSGSLLACGFAEVGYPKSAVLIDAEPGKPVRVQVAELSAGRPLVRWEATEGLAQAMAWCTEGRDAEAWIDLTIHLSGPMALGEVQALRKARERLVHIRPVLPRAAPAESAPSTVPAPARPLDDLFRDFYRRSCQAEPEPELVQLFCELANEEAGS